MIDKIINVAIAVVCLIAAGAMRKIFSVSIYGKRQNTAERIFTREKRAEKRPFKDER